MRSRNRFAAHLLMSKPDHFRVAYEINPWMRISRQPDLNRSGHQWEALYRALVKEAHAHVSLVSPVKACPDLVFTANAGVVVDKDFIPSSFRPKQRRGEVPHFKKWFKTHGYRTRMFPSRCFFEGEGDLLRHGTQWFMGYRFRSEWQAHRALAARFRERVLPLELADKRFYHLDTCFLPLDNETLFYYPGAFDRYARKVIQSFVPNPVAVSFAEARKFVLNGVVVGKTLVTNIGFRTKAKRTIRKAGLRLIEVDLSEFHKSGGSAKCLTLYLPAWKKKQ